MLMRTLLHPYDAYIHLLMHADHYLLLLIYIMSYTWFYSADSHPLTQHIHYITKRTTHGTFRVLWIIHTTARVHVDLYLYSL